MTAIAFPRVMRVGAGTCWEAGDVLAQLGLRKPLIVTDRFLAGQGLAARLSETLAKSGIEARIFDATVPDPTVASVQEGLRFLRQGDHDCVIGFGGGSPMDSAKAMAMLAVHGGEMAAYKTPHVQDAPGLPVIAIPTTAGTGSEATRFTIITDGDTDEKMLCVGLAYMPVAALVDYELTLAKPKRLTADTGIDALTHAIEAYVSRRANPVSDGLARLAMRSIGPNLRRVYHEPANRPAREAMMIGASWAGMAFSNASVALVHGMSRPIGAHFHVPHGLSNAMLLPAVTAYSIPAAEARYADCARAMLLVPDDAKDADAAAALLRELQALNVELEVPGPRAYGIDPDRWHNLLPTMAEQALASGSPGNNPVVPDAATIIDLYQQVWNTP